jgi:hypothetical protein
MRFPVSASISCPQKETSCPLRRDKLRPVAASPGGTALADPLQTEQKIPVLLEYAKASFERIKQRFRHLWAPARVKRVLNDYTLGSDLDGQFGDLPIRLRNIFLSMIHELPPRRRAVTFAD